MSLNYHGERERNRCGAVACVAEARQSVSCGAHPETRLARGMCGLLRMLTAAGVREACCHEADGLSQAKNARAGRSNATSIRTRSRPCVPDVGDLGFSVL